MSDNSSNEQLDNRVPDAWNFNALYNKLLRYVEKMHQQDAGSGEQILYSCIALELLLRASLSKVSPVLLADTKNSEWSHLYSALGFKPVKSKYAPRSITLTDVIQRLAKIYPSFSKEHQDFCKIHFERRNSEFHSGENSFSQVRESSWLPRYYGTVSILLSTMEADLSDILDSEQLATAQALMETQHGITSDQAKKMVSAHQQVWANKSKSDQEKLRNQALVWAKKQDGHRVDCPSCSSVGLLYGEPASSPKRSMVDDKVVESFESLPTSFECIACGLKVSGLSKLTAVGLGERFLTKETFDFADFYELYDSHHEYEPDNNEPFDM